MAGRFEAFVDAESFFRFRLLGPDGTVIAVSAPFEDKAAVAAGIAAARECAGTGLVTDLCPAGTSSRPASVAPAAGAAVATGTSAAVEPACSEERMPARLHAFTLARTPRRQATLPRWTRAATR